MLDMLLQLIGNCSLPWHVFVCIKVDSYDIEGLAFGVYLSVIRERLTPKIRHLRLQGRQTTTIEVRLRLF